MTSFRLVPIAALAQHSVLVLQTMPFMQRQAQMRQDVLKGVSISPLLFIFDQVTLIKKRFFTLLAWL